MKNMICIGCPRGCHISVDEQTLEVTGNFCEKGAEYGKNEIVCPKRTVTSTVACEGGIYSRLPVRTDRDIPKEKIFEVMQAINAYTAHSPVKVGDVLIKNIAGTDGNLIASRNM